MLKYDFNVSFPFFLTFMGPGPRPGPQSGGGPGPGRALAAALGPGPGSWAQECKGKWKGCVNNFR